MRADIHPHVGLPALREAHALRRLAVDGEGRADRDRLPRKQLCGDRPDAPGVRDPQALHAGPFVEGKDAVSVGGGGDDRLGAAEKGDLPRQRVCAAEVPGKKRDREARALVHRHHGGVGGLARQIGRRCTHRDARRADEDQGPAFGEGPAGPFTQRNAVPRVRDLTAEGGAEPLRQGAAFFGEGEPGDLSAFHALPSR